MGYFGCDSVLLNGVPTQPKIILALNSSLSPIPWKMWSREKANTHIHESIIYPACRGSFAVSVQI